MFLIWITHTFMWLLQQSILASILIAAVLLIRRLLINRVSTQWIYGLWFLVILKLVVPLNIQSDISFFNVFKPISTNYSNNPYNIIQRNVFSKNVNELSNFYNKNIYSNKDIDSNKNFNINNSNNNRLLDTKTKTEIVNHVSNNKSVNVHKAKEIHRKQSFDYFSYVKNALKNISLINIISIAWFIIGVIYFLVILILRNKFIRKINKLPSVEDEKLLKTFNKCKEILNIRKNIEIIQDNDLKSPAIFGFIKPVIIMPKDILKQINEENLKYIFFHELSHYKRKDVIINYIVNMLKCIYWFNPVIWYGFSKMREDREISCDAVALSYVGKNEIIDYGQTIIDLLKANTKSFSVIGAEEMVNRKSSMVRRINVIKNFNNTVYRISVKGVIGTFILAGVMMTVPKATIQAVTNANTPKTSEIAYAGQNENISFADKNLEDAVRKAINKTTGNITKKDVMGITNLHMVNVLTENQKVSRLSLKGIENLENLKVFTACRYQLDDISSLSKLHNLEILDLSDTGLKDITLLGRFTKLHSLVLDVNQISDVSSLKNLINLKTLSLSRNRITDITPLKKLTNLEELCLRNNNKLSNISVVKNFSNLKYLDVEDCEVKEINDLKGLVKLKTLDLSNTKISNINALKNLHKLISLYLYNVNVEDISPIKNLTGLQDFTFKNDKITDIDALSSLHNLNYIKLAGNNISNIKVLSKLINLQILLLKGTNVSDISPLKNLKRLVQLSIESNKVTDIRPLSNLNGLTMLTINDNQLSNLNPVSNLHNLEQIMLQGENINNLTALKGLINLKDIKVYHAKKINLSGIEKLNKINILSLENTDFNYKDNINILKGMKNLKIIYLTKNAISDSDLAELKKALPNCFFNVTSSRN